MAQFYTLWDLLESGPKALNVGVGLPQLTVKPIMLLPEFFPEAYC
jgi:hypothetical protein